MRGRGEPNPSGGRPGNRELAPGPPSPISHRNPRVRRPHQAETKSRGAGGKVVGGRGLCAPRAPRAAAGRLPPAAWSASEPGTARTSSSPRRVRRGVPSLGAPLGASAGALRFTQRVAPGVGARQGSPSIRGARVRSQGRLSARRGRRQAPRWRLGAAGAPEGEGGSPALALRRPPSERKACCSVCYCRRRRRHCKPFPGPRRKLRVQWVGINRPGILTPVGTTSRRKGVLAAPSSSAESPARSALCRHRRLGARRQKSAGGETQLETRELCGFLPSPRPGSPLRAPTLPPTPNTHPARARARTRTHTHTHTHTHTKTVPRTCGYHTQTGEWDEHEV